MHIFSKALISTPFETIAEQLKVLSTLGRPELQTEGRSERAEPTEPPRQVSCLRQLRWLRGQPGSETKKPRPNALSYINVLTTKLLSSPVTSGWSWVQEGCVMHGPQRRQRKNPHSVG